MAFTSVDLPIQEMLQTDFITDLATIHNSNVLLLKDKLEDVINTFEIDTNSISIGTDSAINSIKAQDVVIQDSGLIFQTGSPNQIIAQLSQNTNNESVLNVDNLTIDVSATINSATINDIGINGTLSVNDGTSFNGPLTYGSQLVESKETVPVTFVRNGVGSSEAIGTINLTNTSRKNIYVTLEMETTAVVADQVYEPTGGNFNAGITDFILNIDFDQNNPPAQNSTFTIYIVDVTRNDVNTSVLSSFNNVSSVKFTIDAGTNQSVGSPIIMHHNLSSTSQRLGWDFTNLGDIVEYGLNATFNYIVDASSNDRLIINSSVGLGIIQ